MCFFRMENETYTYVYGPERISTHRYSPCSTISSVRRTFCLIALFDLCFCFILWVIYTQVRAKAFFLAGEGQTIQISKCSVLFILWLLMHKHGEWREKKMNFDENGYYFCLFQLTGSETVWEAFEQQVANYKFQTSLFDTVVSYYSNCL